MAYSIGEKLGEGETGEQDESGTEGGARRWKAAKRDRRISLCITEREEIKLKAISSKMGDVTMSEVLRRCMTDRYTKEFPPYREKAKTKIEILAAVYTDEEWCEKNGGKVVYDELGVKQCEMV